LSLSKSLLSVVICCLFATKYRKDNHYLTEQEVSDNIFNLLKASNLSQDKDDKDIHRISFILEEKGFLNEYQEMYYYETIKNVNQSSNL
jgi:hypothetical protein